MNTCKYCYDDSRRCNELHTIDLHIQGGNGNIINTYEVWQCTRLKGHPGVHIACYDDPNETDEKKKHKQKTWINGSHTIKRV